MTKTIGFLGVAICSLAAAAQTCDRTLADFPRLPGETDDAPRLQRAVNALPEGSLYVPKGDYRLASTWMITNRCSVELNRGARLTAVGEMPFLVKIDARPVWRTWNQFFNGGILDGDGKASCLALDGFSPYYMQHVTFLNGRLYGMRVNGEASGGGIFATDLYFRCTKSGLAGNTALYSSGCDGTYTSLLAVDWTVGFRLDGGGNRMTGCHAWGGMVPPPSAGKLPEMLADSVCFWIGGWDNALRDCYADTGLIGYLVEGRDIQLMGSWFLNNPTFKLRDSVVVDQRSGSLAVSDGHFKNDGYSHVYRGVRGTTHVAWSNMVYTGFPLEERYGEAEYVYSDRNLEGAGCPSADAWEYVQDEKGWRFDSAAGEFLGKKKSRALVLTPATVALNRRFPKAGSGQTLVVCARATTPGTKQVELSFTQADGRTWGTNIPLGMQEREIRIPLKDLRYFAHWRKDLPARPGDVLDARKINRITAFFGIWLCKDTASEAHGFEIRSIRIVGR